MLSLQTLVCFRIHQFQGETKFLFKIKGKGLAEVYTLIHLTQTTTCSPGTHDGLFAVQHGHFLIVCIKMQVLIEAHKALTYEQEMCL